MHIWRCWYVIMTICRKARVSRIDTSSALAILYIAQRILPHLSILVPCVGVEEETRYNVLIHSTGIAGRQGNCHPMAMRKILYDCNSAGISCVAGYAWRKIHQLIEMPDPLRVFCTTYNVQGRHSALSNIPRFHASNNAPLLM